MAADTRLYVSKRSAVINRRVAIFLRLTSDGRPSNWQPCHGWRHPPDMTQGSKPNSLLP